MVIIMANVMANTTDEPSTVSALLVIESTEIAIGAFPLNIKN